MQTNIFLKDRGIHSNSLVCRNSFRQLKLALVLIMALMASPLWGGEIYVHDPWPESGGDYIPYEICTIAVEIDVPYDSNGIVMFSSCKTGLPIQCNYNVTFTAQAVVTSAAGGDLSCEITTPQVNAGFTNSFEYCCIWEDFDLSALVPGSNGVMIGEVTFYIVPQSDPGPYHDIDPNELENEPLYLIQDTGSSDPYHTYVGCGITDVTVASPATLAVSIVTTGEIPVYGGVSGTVTPDLIPAGTSSVENCVTATGVAIEEGRGVYHFATSTIEATPTGGGPAYDVAKFDVLLTIGYYTHFSDQSEIELLRMYTLNVSSGFGGSVTDPGEGDFLYNEGTIVPVTATPKTDYTFVNWTGTAVDAGKVADPASASTTVTMDADYTVQANFKSTTPAVSTYSPENITATSARLVACLVRDGGALCTCYFRYWPTDDGEGEAKVVGHKTCTPHQVFRHTIVDLIPETDYSYQGMAVQVTGGTPVEGCTRTFQTDSSGKLVITCRGGGQVMEPTKVNPGDEETLYFPENTQVPVKAVPSGYSLFEQWIMDGKTGVTATISDPYSAETTVTVLGHHTLEAKFVSHLSRTYVSANCQGDGDGTSDNPFCDIQTALDVSLDGGQVVVGGGIYQGGLNFRSNSVSMIGSWLYSGGSGQVKSMPALLSGTGLTKMVSFEQEPLDELSMPVIDANGLGSVLKFRGTGTQTCDISGFVITGGKAETGSAVDCNGTQAVLNNCIIAGNIVDGAQGACLDFTDCNATLINCTITGNIGIADNAVLSVWDCELVVSDSIFWANDPNTIEVFSGPMPSIVYSDVEGQWSGLGNLSQDPLFAVEGWWDQADTPEDMSDDLWIMGDYHLRSQEGRFVEPDDSWVKDSVNSPCIDAGDPCTPMDSEPMPNGNRINMGAYGETVQASKSLAP